MGAVNNNTRGGKTARQSGIRAAKSVATMESVGGNVVETKMSQIDGEHERKRKRERECVS